VALAGRRARDPGSQVADFKTSWTFVYAQDDRKRLQTLSVSSFPDLGFVSHLALGVHERHLNPRLVNLQRRKAVEGIGEQRLPGSIAARRP
jgi:hypothetical protein